MLVSHLSSRNLALQQLMRVLHGSLLREHMLGVSRITLGRNGGALGYSHESRHVTRVARRLVSVRFRRQL